MWYILGWILTGVLTCLFNVLRFSRMIKLEDLALMIICCVLGPIALVAAIREEIEWRINKK